jgi:hypothetical protein
MRLLIAVDLVGRLLELCDVGAVVHLRKETRRVCVVYSLVLPVLC